MCYFGKLCRHLSVFVPELFNFHENVGNFGYLGDMTFPLWKKIGNLTSLKFEVNVIVFKCIVLKIV